MFFFLEIVYIDQNIYFFAYNKIEVRVCCLWLERCFWARVIVCAGAPVFWFSLYLTDPALLCQGFPWRGLGIGHNCRLVQSVSIYFGVFRSGTLFIVLTVCLCCLVSLHIKASFLFKLLLLTWPLHCFAFALLHSSFNVVIALRFAEFIRN